MRSAATHRVQALQTAVAVLGLSHRLTFLSMSLYLLVHSGNRNLQRVLFGSLGLVCVLQALLNVSLRLLFRESLPGVLECLSAKCAQQKANTES